MSASANAGQSRPLPRDSPLDGLNRSLRTLKQDLRSLLGRKQKEEAKGERIVRLNDPVTNDREGGFGDNWISTSKFNVLSFAPKFFYGECATDCQRGTPHGRAPGDPDVVPARTPAV